MTKKIPEGFTTVTPTLTVNGAAKAIDLYKKAFGATEVYRMEGTGGKIMHACIMIGNSNVFLADTDPQMAATPSTSTFYLYLEDVDATFRQATAAGMKQLYPVQDMFWGDRTGTVEDGFGNCWTLATHVRDVSQEEMEEGQKNFNKAA